jgi:hypothetical protein
MPGMPSMFNPRLGVGIVGMLLVSCAESPPVPPRTFSIQQQWQMEPGQPVGNYTIVAGLGDISIQLRGDRIYAPFTGLLQPHADSPCFIFSSPEVPAYLLRFCGLQRPQLGRVAQGDRLGQGQVLHVATLRKQPDGTWALVEPDASLLRALVQAPTP